jgi:very-short-patch-repair endonuclease
MSITRARELRQTMTEAERRLWAGVRDRRLNGLKIRRQCQIGPYYVDFVCTDAGLIIEADGNQHHDAEQGGYDRRRTKFLAREGFHVARFDNQQILWYPAQVFAKIAAIAKERIWLKTQGERSTPK